MRVLWISHFLLYPHTGHGALQRSRNLLIQLAARHELHLLSFVRATDLALAKDIDRARRDLEGICSTVTFVPYPLDRWPSGRWVLAFKSLLQGLPYSVLLYEWPQLYGRIVRLVQERGIDVVLADTLGLADRVLDELNVPAVLTHHNVESEMMRRRAVRVRSLPASLFLRLEAWKLGRYERRVVPRYSTNVTVSELDAERLRRRVPGARITVVPNGVDCSFYTSAGWGQERRGLLFVGPLDWYPNDDAMRFFCRDVWPELARRHSQLTLTVVGRHPSPALRRLVAGDPRVTLTGFVTDTREYARRARVSLCPIRDGGGTRLKVLDAMAQGLPVVSTRLGCEGLDVEEGVHVLFADTVSEFIAQVERLLGDARLQARLSVEGRRLVEERYSFPTLGARLAAALESIAGEGASERRGPESLYAAPVAETR